jgi:chromosomal replication initiator protein
MNSLWAATREILHRNLSENNFKLWIDPLQPIRLDGQTLFLGCPNRFFLSWVKENYYSELVGALKDQGANGTRVENVELEVAVVPKAEPGTRVQGQPQLELPILEVHRRAPLRFNPKFTFDRFVVGAANQYAYSAARAMANGRELNTDSLFILSDHGLGKSHLSHALGQHVVTNDARSRVYYLTAEDFTNELVYSIKNHCAEDFKKKYRRECDVLVLEEVHFLSGKEKVQAELAYTLDNLIENRKRVIFTSAKLPKDIPRLSRQFASRLSNSLISTIEAPDYETRLRIIESKGLENGLKLSDAVLEYMAHHLRRDIRHMESCLNSLGAKSRLLKRSIDLEMARETLADLVEGNGACSAEAIREIVCHYFQVTQEELRSSSRRKNVVLPRNLGMYLSRRLTDLSLDGIGKVFGRNHSTVLYSVNLIENRSRRDPKLRSQVEFLADQVRRVETGSGFSMNN